MKLLRYRANNLVKPAILDNTGKIKDVSSIVNDWNGKTLNDETINNAKKALPKQAETLLTESNGEQKLNVDSKKTESKKDPKIMSPLTPEKQSKYSIFISQFWNS